MKLTQAELDTALQTLPTWTIANGKLHREYAFPTFALAFSFMTLASYTIESMDHHPEWFNVYGKVVVDLTTHSAGGITPKDVRLAQALEDLSKRFA